MWIAKIFIEIAIVVAAGTIVTIGIGRIFQGPVPKDM